jgi:hypothetical protein
MKARANGRRWSLTVSCNSRIFPNPELPRSAAGDPQQPVALSRFMTAFEQGTAPRLRNAPVHLNLTSARLPDLDFRGNSLRTHQLFSGYSILRLGRQDGNARASFDTASHNPHAEKYQRIPKKLLAVKTRRSTKNSRSSDFISVTVCCS